MTLQYVTLRERPELEDAAAEWFHSKWRVPKEAYLDCMDACLKDETTEEGIVESLKAQFEGADEEVIKADVAKALSELRKIEAITD